MIRWDTAVWNRQIKARGDQDKEYVSLHAWSCGCCFIVPKYVQPAPEPKLAGIVAEDTARYRARMGG